MQLAFTREDWERIRQNHLSWWNGELQRPLVLMGGREQPASPLPEAPHFMARLPLDLPADEVIDRYEAHLSLQRWYGDAFPKHWINFGPGIMAGFVGAFVKVARNTVWFEPSVPVGIEGIHPRFDPENPWWRRVRELTETAARRWRDRVCVGYTDLGGNLDILASLRNTQDLLTDLIDAPEEVERTVGEITRLWVQYFEQLHELCGLTGCGHTPWAPIWSPARCYMLQCDFSYMISPDMFERFVLPDLTACCDLLEHGFYHLDGPGELPHLDLLLSMPRLRGVQWIPGDGPRPDPADWPDVLARIRAGGKLCQISTSPEGALKIVREHGGQGFLIHVGGNLSSDEADDLLAALRREDRLPW